MSKYNFPCVSPTTTPCRRHHHQNSCFFYSPFARGKKIKKSRVSDKSKWNTLFSASRGDCVIASGFGAKAPTPEDWSLGPLPVRPAQGECGVRHPRAGFCRQSQQHWVWPCRYLPQFPCRQQDGKEASSAFPRGLQTKFALSVRWPLAAISGFPWALLSGFLVS